MNEAIGQDPVTDSELQELLPNKTSLRHHFWFLDGAYDRSFADKLMRMREEGKFAGLAMASDESPPEAPRFRGQRFQISVFYWGCWTAE